MCNSYSGPFNPRVFLAFALCSSGVLVGIFSLAATPPAQIGWSIVNSADNNSTQDSNILNGTTCMSASNCWAVGYYSSAADQTLIEHWDGTSWAIVSSPNISASTNNYLSGVTCVSASNCWAIGYYTNGSSLLSAYQTLIERWDGTSWAIVSSPNASATQGNVLQAVTCASASDCWAVGYYDDGTVSSPHQTLIEHWDGTAWTIISSPNTSTTTSNILYGVTCTSASECWAVGEYDLIEQIAQTLIERWDGSSWTIVSSPSTSASTKNYLNGVTCTLASDCWAVGYYLAGNRVQGTFNQTLVEHWDGSSWTIVSSPNVSASTNNYLYGLTCTSASDCWAVGYYSGSNNQTLVERWDGTSWTIVSSPNTSTTQPGQGNVLAGVTCVSGSGCWAIGFAQNNYIPLTLIERWDGSSWTIVSSPSTNGTLQRKNVFRHVTCISASDCWAVGYYNAGSAVQTLIERWDGTSWAIVTSPNINASPDTELEAVACSSASNCWAVGSYSADSAYQTLIERWDGTSWAIVSSPNTSATTDNGFYDVTCVSASECWAVGTYNSGTNFQTLIERWDGNSWAILASPNINASPDTELEAVACASASDCWAVGYTTDATSGIHQTLIERWDGNSWAIVTSPNSSAPTDNYLGSVICVSASDCWATGSYNNNTSGTPYQTLVEHWDGTAWAIVSSPNNNPSDTSCVTSGQAPGCTQDNLLYDVTCMSASDCWAAGTYYSNNFQTLIEHWDGTSWTIASSPNTSTTEGGQGNVLYGVTCVSASDCWAVGYANNNYTGQTLTEHYGLPFVQLNAVVSRKVHGSASTFDINLPLTGNPGIECRNGGANGDYTMIFTFANPLTSVDGASVTSGTGSVAPSYIDSSDAHYFVVNLAGVANGQVIKVSLTNVADSGGDFSSAVSATMGVLVGDVNASGNVDAADVGQVQRQNNKPVTSSNFRMDVNVSGNIDAADVGQVQRQNSKHLPP